MTMKNSTKKMKLSFWLLLAILCLSGSSSLRAQLQVVANNLDHEYKLGQAMSFVVSSSANGPATYTINYDRGDVPAIQTGTIDLVAGQEAYINYTPTEATAVFCTVQQYGNVAKAGTVVDPFKIEVFDNDPADFLAHWQNLKNSLAAVPIAPQLTPLFPDPNPNTTDYRINLGMIDGRKVYGYLSIPQGNGPFPALIHFAPFSDGPNSCTPQDILAQQLGAITLSIWAHNVEPDQNDPNAYVDTDLTDKNGIYRRYGILNAIRAIDYLHTRSDVDTERIGMLGVSEGGGFSLTTAGVDDRVKLVVASNPAFCNYAGYKFNRAGGFPYYLNQAEVFNLSTEAVNKATKYYDAARAAQYYDGPLYMIVGYEDEVVYPSAMFAAYNQTRGTSIIAHHPDVAHNHPFTYWGGRLDFIRQHFNIPGNTFYRANAGADQSINGTQTNLSADVYFNNQINYSYPIEWDQVEGPGTATFANKYNKNTSVSFSQMGTYLLRVTAKNTTPLSSENHYFTISDFVEITVGASQTDSTPPNAQCLSITKSLNSNGTVTLSNTEINNNSSDNSNGALTFALSKSTFDCSDIGNNTVIMTVTDAAGNSSTCQATINIEDNIAPNAICRNTINRTLSTAGSVSGVSANQVNLGSTDNCGIAGFNLQAPNTYTCADLGLNTVTLTVFDQNGNSSTCTSNIFVSAPDNDGDGVNACADCNDNNAAISPQAPEIADGLDNNCDGFIDNGLGGSPMMEDYWRDKDGDGYGAGDDFLGTFATPPSSDAVTNGDDCFDWNDNIYPGAPEICNFADDDCNGLADDGIEELFYADWDGDGYGGQFTIMNCFQPTNYVSVGGDCNDWNAAVYPGAPEIPDFIDNDCDGVIDNNVATQPYYRDNDGDGYGAQFLGNFANQPSNTSLLNGDCNDFNANVYPNATEIADGLDNDCNGQTDEGLSLLNDYYQDNDQDGFGKQYLGQFAMPPNSKATLTPGDCDDWDATINPNGAEICNWKDDDCDGTRDEDVGDIYYLDLDGDGYGQSDVFSVTCSNPGSFSLVGGDCDDFNNNVSPGRTEICDGIDNDCDGLIDENCTFGLVIEEGQDVLHLEVEKATTGTHLYWLANSEHLTKAFEIEKSSDGMNFEPLDAMNVHGTSEELQTYFFMDLNPTTGTTHYRVRQLFDNGTYTYSIIRNINYELIDHLTVFPNPATHELFVNVKAYEGKDFDLYIYNQLGQLQSSVNIEEVQAGVLRYDISQLENGMYFIEMTLENKRPVTKRFMVAK